MLMQDAPYSDVAYVVSSARTRLLEAIDIDALWRACVPLVEHALSCYSCSLMLFIGGVHTQQMRHCQTEEEEKQPFAFNGSDAALQYFAANPRVRFYAFSQFELHDQPNDIYFLPPEPAIEHYELIYLAFWDETTLSCVLSIRINKGQTAFSDCALAFLTDLYTMLDAALRRIRSLESERTRQRAIEASLDRLPVFAVVVDQHMTPIYLTPGAEKLCRTWGGINVLPEMISEALEDLLCNQRNTAVREAGGSLTITHRTQPERRMRVDIGAPLHLTPGNRHYVITLIEHNTHSEPHPGSTRMLSLLKQLSPSERKVAKLVSHGLRNDAVAEQLCRSRKTVETQISSIYRKLEIKNRAQLARLFSQ